MATATTTSSTPSSITHAPSETTFTPPPPCSGLYVSSLFDSSLWHADAWPDTICDVSAHTQASCLPEGKDDRYPARIYSSGHYCPIGMTTVTSTTATDGVWCCPSHLTMNAVALMCEHLFTEGNVTLGGTDCGVLPTTYAFGHGQAGFGTIGNDDGVTTMPLENVQVSASAEALFLLTQTTATASVIASILAPGQPSVSAVSTNASGTVSDASEKAKLGGGIGGAIGTALLLCLSFFLIKRHRNRRRGKPAKELDNESYTKPELEGGGRNHMRGPELDGLATRSELEGTLIDNRGAGIHVQKPELEGTQGVDGPTAVHVRGKSELETSTSAPKPTQRTSLEIPELEAIPVSPRDASASSFS
ncbi:hypothetical protein F4779DRAFT_560113 [Xylariaceae sp. FL0662B]|nr:hypothetical protein F4779DRAFT_560113 [Xylariaceae sp. FL0662B]